MSDEKTVTVALPADFFGKSIDEAVVQDIVRKALFESGPIVARNHVHGAFNEFYHDTNYDTAVKLAGLAMRYALENQMRVRK